MDEITRTAVVLCEDVLAAEGVNGFARYACQPGAEPQADLFVEHA